MPVRRAAVSLLHSYERAGSVRLRCVGSCDCVEQVYSTRWDEQRSAAKHVVLAVTPRDDAHADGMNASAPAGGGGESAAAALPCALELRNESDEKVKVDGLAVDTRRRRRRR